MRKWILFAIAAPALAQDWGNDVHPILKENCVGCHDSAAQMSKLDLSTYDGLMRGGAHGPVIVPGKSGESRLFRMISHDMQPAMPMGGPKLAAGDLATIQRWIDAGAKPSREREEAVIRHLTPKRPVKPQIFALAYSPDGGVLALGGYRQVRLLDAESGRLLVTLDGGAGDVRSVAFSRDGRLLAAASGLARRTGEVKLWSVESKTPLETIKGHADAIYAVAFSPDGKLLATSSYDKLIKLWDTATGNEVRTLKDHVDAVYALAFTPDGSRLISGAADRTVKVWSTATGERLFTMGEPLDGINAIALDPTGRMVAAGGLDKTIRIWSLGERSGTLLNSLIAHEDAILALAWSPDGKTLASASSDRTIKVFKADDLSEVKTLDAQPDWVYALRFSPDGKKLAAGRYDGSLSVYECAALR